MYRVLISVLLLLASGLQVYGQDNRSEPLSSDFHIFDKNVIHFAPDDSQMFATESVMSFDNGREISTTINLPQYDYPVKITAILAIYPIPKDYTEVYDPWDRAGNIRLVRDDMVDIEILKFVTSYGGYTEYEVDISNLAMLLRGECVFKAFIDTWLSPGWKVDFRIIFEKAENDICPTWINGIVYEQGYSFETPGDTGVTIEVEIPEGSVTVQLDYLVSGHCTDGADADEFVSKDNVIYVDDIPVYRFQPWRDDCTQFRSINPYTRRWSEGHWSSDFSRSGWCPGDRISPLSLNLSDHLTPGKHKIKFVIEDVRSKNENGDHGYWRISGVLYGWDKKLNRQNY